MATIIGGYDTGLLDSSLYLLNRNDRTQAGETGHGEEIFANVANGNLIIRHQDAWLPSQGEDYLLTRTYNSRGSWNNNVGKGWTLTSFLELSQITSNKITLINPDSSQFTFIYDAATGVYRSIDGAGAYEEITFDRLTRSYVLTRSDQSKLIFDNTGILAKTQDTNGNLMTYTYSGGKLVKIQDDSGHTITYVYTGSDLTQITDETGAVLVRYTYSSGLLTSSIDRAGHVTRYTYYTDGSLQTVTLPFDPSKGEAARTIAFTYVADPTDSTGKTRLLSSITDAQGATTFFEYQFNVDNFSKYNGGTTWMLNALGVKRAQSNDAEFVQWRLDNGYYATWDANRYATDSTYRAQAQAIAARHTTTYTYDKNGEILSVTDPKGYKTSYVYDARENLTTVIDANGYAITSSDDSYWRDLRRDYGYVNALTGQGKLVSELTSAEIAALRERYTTHLAYDTRGNLVTRIDNQDNVTTYTYTSFNKLATQTSAMGNALATLDTAFTQQKRVELGYAQFAANLTAADKAALIDLYTTRFTYDARQNLIEMRSPGGDLTRFSYDSYGNLTRKIVYLDPADLVSPAKQQLTQYFYDVYGNNVKTIDAEGAISYASYDHFGNRTSYTDGLGGVTRYTYDNDNRLVTVTDPENHVTVNAYDSVGNRIAVTDAGGHTVVYVYDRNNMLITVSDPAVNAADSRTSRFTYDVIGERTSVTDAEGHTTRYVWREDGRLVEVLTPVVKNAQGLDTQYRTSYAYDGVGNRITTRDNNGNVSQYVYTENNLVHQTTDALGNVTRYSYDANLNQVQIVIGAQLAEADRRVLKLSYDEENQLTQELDALGAATRYAYDAPGNRVSVTDKNGHTTDFVYERNNRVIKEIRPAVVDAQTGLTTRYTVSHQYDANGNQVASTDENGHTTRYAYDKDNRAVLITDANGNQTAFTYDSRHNRTAVLIGVSAHLDSAGKVVVDSTQNAQVTRFTYNEFNEVVAKIDGVGNALVTSDAAFYQELRTSLGYASLVANLTAADKQALQARYTEHYAYDRVGNRKAVTDARGNTSAFTFDALNRLTTSTDALANQTTYAYDGNGNRVRVTDANGHSTTFAYDAVNRLTDSTDALGVVTHRDYDNVGNLLAETRAAGTNEARTTSYVYDLNNRLRQATDAEGHSQAYEYDAVGNRLKVTDAKGQAARYVYDALNRNIKVIDPLNFETRFEYDGAGNRLSLIDANGGITRFTYDAGNRRIETTDAEGRISHFTYDARNNRVTQTTAYGTASAETTTYAYDAQNNLVGVTDAEGHTSSNSYDAVYNLTASRDANGHVTSYGYDAVNRQIRVTDATGAATTYTYDGIGNRLTHTDALGRVTTYDYDARNQLIRQTAADGVATHYAYDAVGNRASLTTAANTALATTTQYVYNRDNLLVSQTDPLGHTTTYTYDANHNRVQVTDAGGHATTYVYDANNRVTHIIDALGNSTEYRYDANGNRTQVIDARGFTSTTYYNRDNEVVQTVDNEGYVISFTHDANGNVASQTLHAQAVPVPVDPSLPASPLADPADRTVHFAYDRTNRLVARTDAEGYVTSYAYDAVGNRTETRVQRDLAGLDTAVTHSFYDNVNRLLASVSAEGYLTEFAYDAAGNRVRSTRYNERVSLPAAGSRPSAQPGDQGRTTTYAYDTNNRLIRETSALGVDTLYQYDARGNRIAQLDAAATPDQRLSQYRYDAADRLTDTINALGVVTHMELDADGNVLMRYDAYGTAEQRTTTFVYDGNHRVIQQVNAIGVQTYSGYDAAGNLVYQAVWDGADSRYEIYGYDGNNRLISGYNAAGEQTTYEYDAAGNRIRLIQAPGLPEQRSNSFEFDRDNRLVASTDAMGVRTEYRYDGAGNKIETIQAVGLAEQRQSFYVYDLDNRLVEITDPMGAVTRYTYDAIGNQSTIVNANGGVQHNTFDALGRVVSSLSPGGVLTTNTYDNRGNIASTTQSWADGSDSRTTTYAYDLLDHQTRITDADGFSTSIGYDAFGNQVTVAHGQYLPNPTDAGYDPARAARAFVVTNGFTYDAANRLQSMTDGVGTQTTYAYDGFGNRLSTTEAANTAAARTTSYAYDRANRMVETRTPEGGVSRYRYDAVGNKTGEELLQSGDEWTGVWINKAFGYDANGRVTSETDAYGVRTEHSYDAMGNMLAHVYAAGSAEARTVRMEYDLDNRKTADIDALGNRKTYAYDAMGNRIKVTDAAGQVAHYYYNGASRLAAVLDPEGYVNAFAYDSAGNQTEIRVYMNAYTGPVNDYQAPQPAASAADRVTTLAYNGINKEIARVEADGTTTRKEYNGAGSMVTETLYANTPSPRARTYAYDLNNRLIRFTDVDGTLTTFAYDASNNKTGETVYNAADPNSSRSTQYQYDLNNRKIADIFDAAGLNLVQTISYDKLGNAIAKTDSNGGLTTLAYDLNNRVVRVTNPLGETKLNSYDRLGNLVRQTDARGYSTDYVYDGNNRLVQEIRPEVTAYTVDGGQSLVRPTISYVYDAAGNEIQTVDANNHITTRYYNANNRLAAELSGDQVLRAYAYNAAGDQVSETLYMTRLGATDHNPAVRPLPPAGELRITEREYDKAGRLTRVVYPQIDVTTLTGTDGNSPVAVTASLRPEERSVYDAFGNKIATYDKNGQRTLAYYDTMGRQTAVVDALGYLTEFDFDAQGNVLEQRVYAQALDTAALTAGLRPLPPAGEVYVTNRVYDAASRVLEERAAAIAVYDPATGMTSTVRPTTVYTYDRNGNQISKTLAAGTAQAQTEYTYYDAGNRSIAVINAARVLHLYRYDANGNLTQQARFYNTVSASVDLAALTANSNFAALVTSDAANDQTAVFAYDAGNHRSSTTDLMGPGSTDDLTKSYRYDAAGQSTWVSDEDGYVSQTAHDAAGRVIKTVSADGSGTLFDYDAAGNRIYAYTGKIANATLPASQIQATLNNGLNISWDVSGPQGTRSWVVYDSVSHTDISGYGNRSAIQTRWASSTAQAELPTGALGASLYFRVVTQDAAGNQSWTAEQVVVVPPRFSAVAVAQPAAGTLAVSVRFDAGAVDPVLYYGVPGNTAAAVPFVLQADGSYQATLTGVTNAQDLAFHLGWADSAGHTYASAEQSFEYQAGQVAVNSNVSQGTVTDGLTTSYTINVATTLATTVAQQYAVLQAQWRLSGSSSGYAGTSAAGTVSSAGYTTYNLALGDGAPLAAGTYEVILAGVSADGVATQLDTFSYTVGDTAASASLQSLSWIAPPAGSGQLVVIDGRLAASSRNAGRVLVDSDVSATGSVAYAAYYTERLADSHSLAVTSTAVTQTIPDPVDPKAPPTVVILGYDLGVSANLSTAEIANMAGDLHLAWRPAGSHADFGNDTLMTNSGTGSFSAMLALLSAGDYELQLSYTDTQGREVIVDWGVAVSTATASATFTGTSQTVVASETGGVISRDANGVLTLDPGLYAGALDSSRLQTALTLAPEPTGNAGGSADADGRTTGYYAQTQYNALNQQIATNENDGLWRTFGVDANGNVVETRIYGEQGATDYLASYTAYDARNRKVVEWGALAQTASGLQHPVTRTSYNVFDKVTQQTDALGRTHRYAYNALGTVIADTDANGNTETTRIDIFGNTTATVSRLGHANQKFYDLLGHLVEERDASGRSTFSAYDTFGRRTTLTDGNGNSAHYAYDQRDRLTGLTTPLGLNTAYAYDGRNNRITTADARGNTIAQDYDALGRVWRTTTFLDATGQPVLDADGQPVLDENGQPVLDMSRQPVYEYRGYDAYGNLVSETDGEGRIKAYVYGGFSRQLEEIDEDGNRSLKTYDVYGRIASETSPQTGKNIARTYDAAGRLLTIVDSATGVSTVYTYDLMGKRLTENVTTPGDAHNRAYTYTYDALGQMTGWRDSVTGMHLNLSYDAEGNLARAFTDMGYDPLGQNVTPEVWSDPVWTDGYWAGETWVEGSWSESVLISGGEIINPNYRYINHVYSYDSARRLTQLVQEQADSTGNLTQTLISAYTYDAAGNRLTWNNKGIVVTYSYDADRRVTAGAWSEGGTNHQQTWGYDANGNVLAYRTFANGAQKSATVNHFDAQNRTTYTDTDGQVTTRRYDRSGRNTQMVMNQGGKTYYYNYSYFGDGRERSVAASGGASGTSTSSYNANKVRVYVNLGQGDGQNRAETKRMVIDNEGHILSLDHDDGKSGTHELRSYAYANGNPVGETGHGVDGTQSVELDSGSYSLVLNLGSDTPTPAITTYTAHEGDSLQSIAAAIYGNPSLWFVIADANGLNPGEPIKPGTQLKIPNHIQQGQITSDTHKLYSESDIVGSTLPNLKTPPPPSSGGCGSIIMIIIVVVIAVVVAFFTAGAGLLLVNAALGTAYTTLAAAAAGSFLATVVATAVAGAVIAAVGNIVQQGLFIALGYQESFNWNAVGSAAVTGAITGAATAVGAAAKAAEIAAQAGKGAASTATYLNVATTALKVAAAASPQLMNGGKITSWTSLAAAAVGGYVSSAQSAADAQAAVATTDTAIKAANAAASAAQTLSTIVSYVTPWVQLAETYVRNDGNLTPSDWAGAIGSTLAAAVTVEAEDPFAGPTLSEQLANAGRRLGTNLLVAGALSRSDKDAAQGYMENAIGQEAGQLIGNYVGKSLQGSFNKEPGTGPQRVYDPNKRAYVDQSGNAVVLPAQGADRYLGAAGAGGESRDTYGNPVTPIATLADSGAITTDVSPGLLAGSADQNQNQTPQIETHKLKGGESYWSLAKQQLGPDASNADIQRQVYALMELNPGLDPRTLQVGQSINLIGPNSGTTISAGTLAAYGASDAEYQGYREQQAQLAKAQEVMTLQAAYANSANAVYMDMGGTGLSDATAPATSSEPSLLSRFGRGLVGALESVTVEPIRQTRDIAMAGASVFYNEVVRKEGEQYWLPEMTSNTARAFESGTSQAELLLQSNPVTGVGVLSYNATTAAMEGRYGDLAEMAGGVAGGLAIGKATSKFGGYGVRLGDIEATGPLASQAGAIKLELVTPEKPSAYSVAFETKLDPADFGTSREVHYNRANAALDSALRADSEFAGMMNELIPGVHSSVSSVGGRTTPSGWTWEHASSSTAFGESGVMRLVPTSQHTPGSPWWRTIHPNTGASGGYAEWAIPAGAKKN